MNTSQDESNQLKRMRLISSIEGATLILLVFVAVPMKHAFGIRQATSLMGPVHGLAFVVYIWMLIQTVSVIQFTKLEVIRMVAAAFIPFGGFYNERALAKRQHPARQI